ncbi:CapA family protein [Mucilaginibacter sp. BJC16-A38]|uniref:CapA family protein n=1 Tax=Mucilaginibacter phenanthrenivorans TaxID=1234842 RepID=UPI0021574E68|nr:CapA family protein [Mucilaginibacter phenanthrenivorans]MCR8557728.1 CapA family protein [Mucilaginibacter phenanthrenivorans]
MKDKKNILVPSSWLKQLMLLFIAAAILFFTSCRQHRPPPEVYHPPIKKTVIIKRDTIKRDTAERDSFCIAAVGDIMLGTSYPDNKTLPPDSAKGSFKNVLQQLRDADLTFGNLEGTLLDTGAPANYRLHQLIRPWLFRMPESYGGILKDAGFKVLSLANNHIGDFDDRGRKSTMKVLDSLGIKYGGQVSHPSSIFKLKGVTYGFCAFAPNGYTLSILDLKNAARIISDLKQKCDVVIVSFHGGGEGVGFEHVPFVMETFVNEKRGDVNAFAHAAIDAGADLVFGNGPHVCRALELYNDRLIAYSLGNFCTYTSVSVAGPCGYAPILKVNINKKGEFLSGQIISGIQTHYNGLQLDTLNKAAIRIKQLTETDFPDAGVSISDDGRITLTKE